MNATPSPKQSKDVDSSQDKSFTSISTNVTAPTGMLTTASIIEAMDEFKKKPVVKEVRVRDMRFKVDIMSDEPLTPLQELYGIPIVVDPKMDKHKAKLVYADGKEVVIDLQLKDSEANNG